MQPTEETQAHLNHLDGWRGIAVGLVILGHFWGDAHLWSGMSKLGVALFFVLSGRLMSEILFVRKSKLDVFFLRRFSRVYPALLMFVLITTIAFWGSEFGHKVVAALVALTFTINYAMIYTHPVAVLDHLWSLCVEEHAYVLLAGIAFLARRKTFPVGVLVFALGLAALLNGIVRTLIFDQDFFFVHWRSDVAVAPIFLASGLWLWLRNVAVPPWLSPISLVAAVSFNVLDNEIASFGLTTLALALAVTTVDHSWPVLRAVLAFPGVRHIGLWSYSLYLWQQPFYKLHSHDGASVALMIAATFACALGSFYLVERPARSLINKVGARALSDMQRRVAV